MKKIITILGIMMLLMVASVSATMIDDFTQTPGLITTSTVNELGYPYAINWGSAEIITDDLLYIQAGGIVGQMTPVEDGVMLEALIKTDENSGTWYLGSSETPGTAGHWYVSLNMNAWNEEMTISNGGGNTASWAYDFDPLEFYKVGFVFNHTDYTFLVYVDDVLQPIVGSIDSESQNQIQYYLFQNGGGISTYVDYIQTVTNTEPVINSIAPSDRVELTTSNIQQIYTSDVTDEDGDAEYSWVLGGIEVSTSETYTANWAEITPGIYTLQLEVSDAEYSNTASSILEIRARGGSSTSFSIVDEPVTPEVVETNEDAITPDEIEKPNVFVQFWNWIAFWK